jgi:hypothetical protein
VFCYTYLSLTDHTSWCLGWINEYKVTEKLYLTKRNWWTAEVSGGASRYLSRCQTWHQSYRFLCWYQIGDRCQLMSQSVPNVAPVVPIYLLVPNRGQVPANVSVGAKLGPSGTDFCVATKSGTGASRYLSRCQTWHQWYRFLCRYQIGDRWQPIF